MQHNMNGDMQPCGCLSQTFLPTKCNYDIFNWELLAVICGLEEWKQYVLGSLFPVEALIDHKNLTYFKEPCKLFQRQAWWLLFLQDFNMVYWALFDTQMSPADALSHLDDVDAILDNTNVQLLPSDAFDQ